MIGEDNHHEHELSHHHADEDTEKEKIQDNNREKIEQFQMHVHETDLGITSVYLEI